MDQNKQDLYTLRWYAKQIEKQSNHSTVRNLAAEQVTLLSKMLGDNAVLKVEPKVELPDANLRGAKLDIYPAAMQHSRKMRTRGKYANGYPLGAVVHFTAGRDGAGKTIDGGIKNGYTFLCIQKDGLVAQAHPISQWGYHAGESAWKPLIGGVSDDLIGIEINAAGRVEKQENGTFKTWFGTYLSESDVRYTEGKENQLKGYYEKYTAAQEKSLIEVLLWLKHQAPDIFRFDYVLGHDEVAGPLGIGRWRKNDPGAALSMTMNEFRALLKKKYAEV